MPEMRHLVSAKQSSAENDYQQYIDYDSECEEPVSWHWSAVTQTNAPPSHVLI
jgi:hypothetical protein